MPPMKEAIRIVLMCVLAAVAYGIVHDQITVRVCPEYFTIGHRSPDALPLWLLGLYWGVVATWWVGALLGVGLAAAARAGRRPKLTEADLRGDIVRLMAVAGAGAVVAGVFGYVASLREWLFLPGPLYGLVPQAAHHRFMADAWTHGASYLIGAAGGLALIVRTWNRRRSREEKD